MAPLAPTREELDVSNWAQVDDYFASNRPATVFHLASSLKGRRGCEELLEVFSANTAGTVHVLEASRRHGCARLLVTGTGDETGSASETDGQRTPSQPKEPRSVYAATKAAATLLLEAARRFGPLQPTVCRLFAVYGPAQSEDFLIPQLLSAAKSGQPLSMTGGKQARDFVWLGDVVEVLIRAAQRDSARGQTVDVCSGTTHSLRELVATLAELAGVEQLATFGEMAYRPGEPFKISGDPVPLQELLGPMEFTSLRDGLARLL